MEVTIFTASGRSMACRERLRAGTETRPYTVPQILIQDRRDEINDHLF